MIQTHTTAFINGLFRLGATIVVSAFFLNGCASGISYNSGISLPGGGSVGGGLPGGGSSGGSSGDSSGGGMQMPGGGASGGGSSGGGSPSGGGASGGGTSGASGTMGGQSSIPQVGLPGGGADGQDCDDGGISGGGFGGGMDCDPSGDIGQFPGDAERAEELGAELDKSVGEFDEALADEQREISSVGRNTEGFGSGSSGSGGTISLGEQAAGASGGSGGGSGGAGGAAGSSETESGPLDGMSDQDIRARTPDDIDATTYDDIVARQLREAAIAEDDPELRERLWEEYRKYKGLK